MKKFIERLKSTWRVLRFGDAYLVDQLAGVVIDKLAEQEEVRRIDEQLSMSESPAFLAIPSIHPGHGVLMTDDNITDLVHSCERFVFARHHRKSSGQYARQIADHLRNHTMTDAEYDRKMSANGNDSGQHGAAIPSGVDLRTADSADNDT